jgi:hypothetical protein
MESDSSQTTDNGSAYSGTYLTGAIRAEGRKVILPSGKVRELEVDSVLTLHDVTITYLNNGAWTPTVEVSIDGGTSWLTVSDGVAIGSGATNLGRYMFKAYTVTAGLPGTWFQARVTGTDTTMQLAGIRFEFTYSGSDRNDLG